MYEVKNVKNGKYYEVEGKLFTAQVYVPDNDLPGEIINFGYNAPYLMVFAESKKSEAEIVEYSISSGLAGIAAKHDAGVSFVYPVSGDWSKENAELFKEIIANSKIGPVYKDGVLINKDRFGQRPTTYAIRGAIFRTYLYGEGKAADYLANNLMTTVNGEYLWGPGEITPVALCLKNLSGGFKIDRRDIPVISVNNSDTVNGVLTQSVDHLLVKEAFDYADDYENFLKKYIRWCGNLVVEPDFDEIGVVEEYGVEEVKTSSDNSGEFSGTQSHKIGYMAWYNKGLFDGGKVPLVMVSHGGGDSALHIAKVSGWWEIAHKYNFLLVAVENHTSVTATETVELLERIKEKYPIDETRMYASGFSMGGCKSWDMLQEYPDIWAALAPMDATFEVGLNLFGKPAIKVNDNISVPVFYAGGEITPLPELPFQAEKCLDRISYLFKVNRVVSEYNISLENVDDWKNPIWGIDGDRVEKFYDASRDSVLTVNYFASDDGVERTALASISGQGHECRQHTCEQAWLFMSKFTK